MTVTVPTPISRHRRAYVVAAVAAVALVISVLVGLAITDTDSSPAVTRTGSGVAQELPSRFSGSPDAVERRALDDPARYGSPDAAEEWNR